MKWKFKDYVFLVVIFVVMGLVAWGAVYLVVTNEQSIETKKGLCLQHNFTWEEHRNGQRVNDCYSIDDGIIQFYDTWELNGKVYLTRGWR